MSQFYTGRTGQLTVGGKTIAKIRDWSIETTVELISTNTVDSRFNSFVPGVAGATGSATVMYYRDTGENNNANKQDFTQFIGNIMKTDTDGVEQNDIITFVLKVDSGATDQVKFNGYITSLGIQVSTGEVTTVPISFTVDGKFTDVPSN
nr:phage major tail protein 2 [uncultured Mediterranean phage uvMED]BAR25458.1 phage major tail protein 2 [uncultured Mediterranean phage uvMED]